MMPTWFAIAGVAVICASGCAAVKLLACLMRIAFAIGDEISDWIFWQRVISGDTPAPYRSFYDDQK